MDRRVKERLVGASILVLLLVLIVPELLSGPKSAKPAAAVLRAGAPEPAGEPVRNITVDLATSKPPTPEPAAEGKDIPTSAASAASAAGVPGGTATNVAPPTDTSRGTVPSIDAPRTRTAPVVTTLPAAVPAAPLETPASSPTLTSAAPRPASNRAWAVQLGSFASRANSDKLAHQLKTQGFSVYVLSGDSGRSARYRVRIGPLGDRAAATQVVAKLKGVGHAASIVPPAP